MEKYLDAAAVSGQEGPSATVSGYTCAFSIGLGACRWNWEGNLGRSVIQLAPAVLFKESSVIDTHLAA